jgi:HEPN superfamily AbiU2-like protein
MEKSLRQLDDANIELSKTLMKIHDSLGVYSLICLNASMIKEGRIFFGVVQQQQVELIAIGFAKVFEREKAYRLNSIPSILLFIEQNDIVPTDPHAVSSYLGQWKKEKGGRWINDLRTMLDTQYSKYRRDIGSINEARNTHIAHSQAGSPSKDLPSVAVFQDLLGLAFGFHDFINSAFINTHSHRILTDTGVQTSLANVLRAIGVSEVATAWPE